MGEAETCPDCGGELFIGSSAPRDDDEGAEPAWERARERVGVCSMCDETWRESGGSEAWTRVDRVGTRHC